jgi:dephospho-CoA kinase
LKVIGLTGGIASGKSTVSNYLRQLGAVIIDADVIARELVEPGGLAYQEVVDFFGTQVLTPEGRLDRVRLGQIVFSDPHARQQLNQIIHPMVKEKTREILAVLAANEEPEGIAVVDAPLLIEVSMTSLVDQVWLIAVDEETQISRLIDRNGLSIAEARSRIASQMPLEEKRKWADLVVDNCGNLTDTLQRVQYFWNQLSEIKYK